MIRRLLAQFGLTALVVALGAGAALADSATPNVVSKTNDLTNITVTDPGSTDPTQVATTTNITASTNITSSTTTGSGSIGSSGSSSGTGPVVSGNQGSGQTVATPADQSGTAHSTTPPAGTNSSAGAATTNNPDATAVPTTTPSSPIAAASAVLHSTLTGAAVRAVYIGALTPVLPAIQAADAAAGLTHQPPAAPPQSPVGLLDQLHILLISTLVPSVRLGLAIAAGTASSHAGLVAIALITTLITLACLAASIPVNSYTARLRRSGFLGAARSDVGAAHLLFATPREMSSIGALSP